MMGDVTVISREGAVPALTSLGFFSLRLRRRCMPFLGFSMMWRLGEVV